MDLPVRNSSCMMFDNIVYCLKYKNKIDQIFKNNILNLFFDMYYYKEEYGRPEQVFKFFLMRG